MLSFVEKFSFDESVDAKYSAYYLKNISFGYSHQEKKNAKHPDWSPGISPAQNI